MRSKKFRKSIDAMGARKNKPFPINTSADIGFSVVVHFKVGEAGWIGRP